ncbi:LCP family protein [Fredinandcohnia sp. 179-A 10B2 NHS]|uniref:LCP family protein n=1 Tax=Fredinandcohnia sp. 179-A 10B2 NHS TaxID=3235176 RepID=UPI0039A36716
MNRTERRKPKKRFRKFLITFLLIILSLSGYIFYQYYQGIKIAEKDANLPTTVKESNQEFNGADIKNTLGKVNVLLLGVDSRGEAESRTDTIMIAQFDPKEQTAKLVSVMRDIYAEIPGYRNYKINTAYFLGGPELLRQSIKQNFDIDIQYYALIDFNGFTTVVNTLAPNGIEMNVEKRMEKYLDVVLEPGKQQLNGEELLSYARFRADSEADFGRVKRQQEVVSALKDEVFSLNGISKIPKLVGTIQPYVETNLEGIEMMGVLKDFILNKPDEIETLRIPIDNSYRDAEFPHAGAVLEIDMETNKIALNNFLNGEER